MIAAVDQLALQAFFSSPLVLRQASIEHQRVGAAVELPVGLGAGRMFGTVWASRLPGAPDCSA